MISQAVPRGVENKMVSISNRQGWKFRRGFLHESHSPSDRNPLEEAGRHFLISPV
jgi:hypothetical protein